MIMAHFMKKKNLKKIGISTLVLGAITIGAGWINNYINEKELEAKVIRQDTLTIEEAYEAVKLQNKKIRQIKKNKSKIIISNFKSDKTLMKKLNNELIFN